ncbi:MAG: single-stranded-DNA-specific exonuclease RecJ [Rhizobiales bacterium]|nr:single-stranded-DNA-specific exonuclease RecJ [Hyphomicrobiales bacterium]
MTESSPARRLFLDVAQSARGLSWRDRLDPLGAARAGAIAQRLGLPDLLARVLAGRGVGPDEAEAFLDPTVRRLMPDPRTLQDMAAATQRLSRAAASGECVAVFGDYDVDGAASSALLADFLEAAGTRALIHIPDRIFEGYGPNAEAIDRLAGQGATLLVTVDCGTTSHAALEHAKARGLDVIVLDHHQAPERLPEVVALVNPNRQDDLSGLGYLCAAGVVFMTLVDLNRALREAGHWSAARPAPNLIESLDLVALATVADVTPLVGLNRAFVVKGCELMKGRGRPGLAALADAARVNGPIRPYHLGFLLGPRINAGGRIGDAALGARLLRERVPEAAARIAAQLDQLNRERQTIEVATVLEAEAEAIASLGVEDRGPAVVTSGEGWHPGVVGLVAARLKERFRRPAFAIAFAGDVGTGSARSVVGVDLGRAVRAAVEAGILIKGGGHAMAAGLTIARDRLGDFRAFLETRLGPETEAARAADALDVDAALTARGASVALFEELDRAGPYGSGNPEPLFVLARHRIVDLAEVGEGHLRLTAQAGDGARLGVIAFRAAASPLGEFLRARRGEIAHLAGHLTVNRYRGEAKAQFRLVDAAEPHADRPL